MSASSPVHVAVGVLFNANNEVLISRRHRQSHQGGLWEFPGGKVEGSETLLQALDREFQEELGIRVRQAFPLLQCPFDYEDKSVLLDVWEIAESEGTATGLEGQEIAWRTISALDAEAFPAANVPIIDCLKLPREIAITPEMESQDALLSYVEFLIKQGVAAIQLRQKQLAAHEYSQWFRSAQRLASQARVLLFSNTSLEQALELRAHAVHLDSARLMACETRPVSADTLLSASCHGAQELLKARDVGVNLAMLSPVAATPKYAEQSLLGWSRFTELRATVGIPVFALGGLRREQLAQARRYGAFGIAGIHMFAEGYSR